MMNKKVISLAALAAISVVFAACGGKKEEAAAPAAPPAVAAAVSGKDLYNGKGGCAACHGETGKGDGPTGVAVKAANFTAGFKKGGDLAGVSASIKNGVPGTAMAGYAAQLNDGEVKAVAEYVIELSKAGH